MEGNYRRRMMMSLTRVGFTVFNNPVGIGKPIRKKPTDEVIKFGLAPGSADVVGWRSRKEPYGSPFYPQPTAIFCSFEMKMPQGVTAIAQAKWQDNVNDAGGFAVICRAPNNNPTQAECDTQAEEFDKQWRQTYE